MKYLKYLTRQYSPDIATIYLATKIVADKANSALYSVFNEELSRAREGLATSEYSFHSNCRSYIILFVPGWVYKSEPESGADFARPRGTITKYQLENALVEIPETGTIEENAHFIASEIVRVSQLDKKVVLVSASSGGASTALALGKLLEPCQLRAVKGWV